ncbi:MAG: XdhC family protein [Eggerthellaceae bacterium]|nr:XdhC family protein [Eggerthellaceae bacterium]
MKRQTLVDIVKDLEDGRDPHLSADDFTKFSEEESAGNDRINPQVLADISATLGKSDIPTFERAIQAMDDGELAWIGFKIVYDPDAAVSNVDNEVTKKYGQTGSADGSPMVFFCNDAKQIVAPREYAPRDTFQMKDGTRGPSMHNEQFEGLTWASEPLFGKIRVWLLGASDVAVELSKLARHVGFHVTVVDYDPAYLNEERFPGAELIMLHGDNFDELSNMPASDKDYICVLTRGHMFDPQGCIWGIQQGGHYVAMMGSKGKNQKVHDLVIDAGVTEEQWDSVKRPIGIKIGAISPAEIAIAIIAEMIDVRYRQRYDEAARAKHESDLEWE